MSLKVEQHHHRHHRTEIQIDEATTDPSNKGKLLTPLRAIRVKCLDCSGGSSHEVQACTVVACALYPYRFGKRPATVAKHQTTKRKNLLHLKKGHPNTP